MVLDTLRNSARYVSLHPEFAKAFDFLEHADWAELAPGSATRERHSVRHPLDGDRLYVSIDHGDGRGRAGARLEAHRRHIDIQFTIEGDEEIGSEQIEAQADEEAPTSEPPESAPLAGRGTVKKAIVKIAIDGRSSSRGR